MNRVAFSLGSVITEPSWLCRPYFGTLKFRPHMAFVKAHMALCPFCGLRLVMKFSHDLVLASIIVLFFFRFNFFHAIFFSLEKGSLLYV